MVGALERTSSAASSFSAPGRPPLGRSSPGAGVASHLAQSVAAVGSSTMRQLNKQYKAWRQGEGPSKVGAHLQSSSPYYSFSVCS